jgi:hypothetical protein
MACRHFRVVRMMLSEADEAYFKDLRFRLDQAVEPRFCYDAHVGVWVPNAKRCHDNVDYYAEHHGQFESVRGWVINSGWAIPHSVLRDIVSGSLIDITPPESIDGTLPQKPWQQRRFLCHVGPAQFDRFRADYAGGINISI